MFFNVFYSHSDVFYNYAPGHMRLPHRLQGQKVKSQGGAGACCGGHLAAQLVIIIDPHHWRDSTV